MIIMTMASKNINVTVIKQASIYNIYLLIIERHLIIGLSPNGCISAADSLYIKEITTIFIAGKTVIDTMINRPTIPVAFFNNNKADNTVSAASVNAPPTTGIKLPVINFVVFNATPSCIALEVP